jgi:hypothetical protein
MVEVPRCGICAEYEEGRNEAIRASGIVVEKRDIHQLLIALVCINPFLVDIMLYDIVGYKVIMLISS